MEGLGEFLKRGRENAGISLDDLAQRTRIRVENLVSLEREDLDSLPSDAYVRGFVRQVCREVGLAPHDGLVRYETLRARGAPPDEITWAEERVEETPGRLERALEDPERVVRIARKGGRLAAGVVLAALVVLGGVLARRAMEGGGTEVTAAAPAPAERAAAPAPEPAEPRPQAQPEPQPQPAARHSAPEPSRATVDVGVGALPDPAKAAPVRPARDPEPADPGPMAGPAATEPAAPERADPEPAAAGPQEAVAADASGQTVLELRASRPVEVTLLLDGMGAERHARLEAGERRSWKADRHFVLRASDGGALQVLLDGRSLGRAGDDGVPTFRTIGPAAR